MFSDFEAAFGNCGYIMKSICMELSLTLCTTATLLSLHITQVI